MHKDILSLLKLPLIAWNGKSFASQAYDAVFARIVEADRADLDDLSAEIERIPDHALRRQRLIPFSV